MSSNNNSKLAIEYIILKLYQWGKEDGCYENVAYFNIKNDLTAEKLSVLPYLLTTANGVQNRENFLHEIFTSFEFNNDLGYVVTGLNLPNINSKIFKLKTEKVEVCLTDIEIDVHIKNMKEQYSFTNHIDYSIDTIFKYKHEIKLYKLDSKDIIENIKKSPIFQQVEKHFKTNVLQTDKTIPQVIIKRELSVYSESLEGLLAV